MIPYLGLVLFFGRIREVRLLLPTTIAFIPATLVVLSQWLNDTHDADRDLPPPTEQKVTAR
jgi:hypothetical protein